MVRKVLFLLVVAAFIGNVASAVDRLEQRKLSPESIDCKSSTYIECILTDSDEPCDFQVEMSDCSHANNNEVFVPVAITYTYCNWDNDIQVSNKEKTIAKFKGNFVDIPRGNKLPLLPNTCNTWTIYENVNPCMGGASTSLKYEGNIPTRTDSFCYSYEYIKVQRKRLAPDISIMTNIACKLEGTEVDCAGNILQKAGKPCNLIPVTFEYEACYYNNNTHPGEFVNFNQNKTWAKLQNFDASRSLDLTILTPTKPCNLVLINTKIDTCDEETTAEFKVTLTMYGTPRGNSESFLQVNRTFIETPSPSRAPSLSPSMYPSHYPSSNFENLRLRNSVTTSPTATKSSKGGKQKKGKKDKKEKSEKIGKTEKKGKKE